MALVLVNGGEAMALQYLVNAAVPQNLILKLFTNNISPQRTDTVQTYAEASGFGYSSINLVAGNWVVSGANPTTITYPQQTFTFTGNLGNVFGYYIIRATSLDLVWSERFTNGPYNIVNNGDQIQVTLTISQQ